MTEYETANGNTSSLVSVGLALIRLMRPEQWIKNGFVLAPLVFAGRFLDRAAVAEALLAALLFSLASSATYILNDLHDLAQDRKHPRKSRRPLAAGQVSKSHALVLFALLCGALIWSGLQRPNVGLVLLAYLVLNLAYTFVLKHQPVVDIFSIAIGFILRVQPVRSRWTYRSRPGCLSPRCAWPSTWRPSSAVRNWRTAAGMGVGFWNTIRWRWWIDTLRWQRPGRCCSTACL